MGSRSQAQTLAFDKTFVNYLKLVTFNLITMFNNFTFHFSRCRSGLLSLSLRMHLPSLILFHQVTFPSKNMCKYTERKRKKGRKAHISHLPGHSTTQPQGTSWMSRTIRVNDKSDVVHSLGKHSPHKGRQVGKHSPALS